MKYLILPMAVFIMALVACKNDPKTSSTDSAAEPSVPVITQELFSQEYGKVQNLSDSLSSAIKIADDMLTKAPKAIAAKASPYLESLEGMQEKSMMIQQEFDMLKQQVEGMTNGSDSPTDGAPADIQRAIDEMNVTRQSIMETIKLNMDSVRAIINKKG